MVWIATDERAVPGQYYACRKITMNCWSIVYFAFRCGIKERTFCYTFIVKLYTNTSLNTAIIVQYVYEYDNNISNTLICSKMLQSIIINQNETASLLAHDIDSLFII